MSEDIIIEFVDYKKFYFGDNSKRQCNCCSKVNKAADYIGIKFNREQAHIRLCKECLNKLELIILNKYNYNTLEQENIELNNEIYLLHKERKLLQEYVGGMEDRIVMLEDYVNSKIR